MTNDSSLAEKISLLRDHGRDSNGVVIEWGLNSRLTICKQHFSITN